MITAAWALLGSTYLILGLIAYKHIESDSKSEAFHPGWCIPSKLYDDKGRDLCFWGRINLVLMVMLLALDKF
jgi:hypothetical protein